MENGIEIFPNEASIPAVEGYVEDTLARADVTPKQMNRINIAVDEIYSNVVLYSGAKNAWISCSVTEQEITVTFRDDGKLYDPLNREDPDITLSAEERGTGGLGIFMVKKLMSEVRYRAENGQNLTTIILKRTE